MTYLQLAQAQYATGYARQTEIEITLRSINNLNMKIKSDIHRQLVNNYRQLVIDLDDLEFCLTLHQTMTDPDDETINSLIQAGAEVKAAIDEIDDILKLI